MGERDFALLRKGILLLEEDVWLLRVLCHGLGYSSALPVESGGGPV